MAGDFQIDPAYAGSTIGLMTPTELAVPRPAFRPHARHAPLLFLHCAILWAAFWMPIPGQAAASQSPASRPTVILDGTWEFATDPDRAGEQEQWFLPDVKWPVMPRTGYASEADGHIQVLGIWDAQGYGTETDKVRHNFVGLGWYRRQVTRPAEWEHKRVFFCVGGVHRYAKAWVNGHYLGEHIGYLSEFEVDITAHAHAGTKATIVFQLDSNSAGN